jgi:integrase/recombinase XerD
MTNTGKPKNWEETVSLFQEYLWAQGKAEETITAYGVDLKRFGKFYIDGLKKPGPHISRIKEGDLQAYIKYMASERYFASSAINRAIAALRLFSRYILENGWNRQNIAADLRTYSLAPPGKPIELTPAEIRKLCVSVKNSSYNSERDYAIFQTLLQCGLRLNEVCRSLIRDLKLKGVKAHIRVEASRQGYGRSVPLNTTVKRALSQYLKTRGETSGQAALFLSTQNKPISAKTIQYLIKKHFCAIGRPELSVHDIRQHFALSLFDQSGGDLSAVQQLMGHRNIVTTARYVRISQRDMSDVMEKDRG